MATKRPFIDHLCPKHRIQEPTMEMLLKYVLHSCRYCLFPYGTYYCSQVVLVWIDLQRSLNKVPLSGNSIKMAGWFVRLTPLNNALKTHFNLLIYKWFTQFLPSLIYVEVEIKITTIDSYIWCFQKKYNNMELWNQFEDIRIHYQFS